MKQTDIIRGLGLDSPAGRAALADAWRTYLAPAAGSVLGQVYDKCAADAGLRVFLWDSPKDDWVRSQTERWSKVFLQGVDDEHVRRVEGFARDDLKSGMDPTVYGVFFGIFAASATAQILTHGVETPAVADAVKAVSALANVETTLAFSSYYHALREQTAGTIDGLTGSLHDNVSENIAGMASATEELSATMRTIEVTVDRNTQHAQAISGTVEEVRTQINDLRKAIEGILSLLGSIKDIAGQTNLLALNATIEAAPGGRSRARFCRRCERGEVAGERLERGGGKDRRQHHPASRKPDRGGGDFCWRRQFGQRDAWLSGRKLGSDIAAAPRHRRNLQARRRNARPGRADHRRHP